jgi:two-component system sensor histidine kinase TctE
VSSIRLRLLAWLAGPIVFVNLAAAALAYLLAWAPAGLAFDGALQEAARAAARDPLAAAHPAQRADGGELTWVAVRAGGDGRLLAGAPGLPPALPEGAVGDALLAGEPVRHTSVRAVVAGQPATLTLARTVRQRRQVRAAMLRGLVLLESVCSLALVGLIWMSVTNGLAPLARLRASLDRRDSVNLAPLPEQDMGHELQPVAAAFNALLERIAEATRAQREFQANVAHQLRTPLAGARLQLEWLADRHRDDSDTAAAVARLLDTNERLTRETNQLLALARAEPSQPGRSRFAPLDLAGLVADGVQAFVERAAARGIDLGFALEPATVDGDVFLLRDLLDNLVDNALRYTPPGGSVTVRCGTTPGGTVLEVEDDGPGIPPAQRARVFERFVRLAPEAGTTGSGLGLAIVRDIARLHGARVELGDGAGGKGARFTIHFPARRA